MSSTTVPASSLASEAVKQERLTDSGPGSCRRQGNRRVVQRERLRPAALPAVSGVILRAESCEASVVLTGANARDFAVTKACGTSLPRSGICNLTVTFTPAVVGMRTATLTMTDNNNDTRYAGDWRACSVDVTFLPTAASPLTKTASLNVNVATFGQFENRIS